MTELYLAEMSTLRLAPAVDGLLFAQVDFSKARAEGLGCCGEAEGRAIGGERENSSLEVKLHVAEKSAHLAHDRVGFLNSRLEALQSELDKERENHKNVVAAKDVEIGEPAVEAPGDSVNQGDHLIVEQQSSLPTVTE
ncbi:hypothetical protein COLO4_23963 [Corchorus olitorius]|uniref:Uncharacterized protein n=1 Tax=Corchorus olitorius TaxID=93759 RepID=A0A1R3IDZ0_9ROSI|nr:hypothetical protein COLO4_23963 [Corchorus olitorius]